MRGPPFWWPFRTLAEAKAPLGALDGGVGALSADSIATTQAPEECGVVQSIVPMIAYEDGLAAVEFLTRAFGFTEDEGQRYMNDDGTVGHAELELAGDRIMLATPNAEYRSPSRHRETGEQARRWLDNPWVVDGVFVKVEDVDAHHANARAAGATIIRPLGDPGVGGRVYTAEDPEGHRWMFGQSV